MRPFAFVVGFFIVAVLLATVGAQLPSESRAKQAAENIGLHSVRVTDRSPAWGALGGCKEDDLAKFTVVGYTDSGQQRTIQVCAPWPFGGYTIRS